MSDDLYREAILDYYKHPRHKGHLDNPDIQYHDHNPFCGDEITVELKVENGVVVDAAFDGHGCAISQATASMLMEEIIGKPLDDLKALDKEFILEMLGIEIGPVRLKCALLPLKVLKAGAYGLEEWPE
ncbi:MAG: SUF system NifU family Fe-S cluster assembly protein [Caldilinea sp.]|nr:SUF system NifU family Fe-S cluster assembly protein [Caldilinea sp.]MCB0067817.1 SUF system NifU family Fe-S cluster assembly protein [Caldilineaceae bacterium]MCB0048691.1 SUF system NifU family Fe-S cluster assembly protein [Caldilinea sp.]MCB0137485.1 SUF system NifU family Fe-S cluster assembly protein [Caldilineaceae bacterium]MCB9113620.1 SUF system NifU family Fe-S cluster assembly protein [Caldilineaceae bacterium]